ncbi:MAG: hypothetical protein B6I22_03285 [Desulfobacteraceae bacterium 4572_123]|nr:MAG: hypothetical protein B6I22_03285 [Desulfobacteraceae bacterium 4572_123]
MIFFDGTYRLGRRDEFRISSKEKKNQAWRIRIIDFKLAIPDIEHLKPYAIVATPSEPGIFATNCAHSLGRRILRDFNLKIEKTLWVEQFQKDPEKMYVAVFIPKSFFGPDVYYRVDWHPIMANELAAIKPFIPEADTVIPIR